MQDTPEKILDHALARLINGESIDVIAKDYPEFTNLTKELRVMTLLKSIPIAKAPSPSMRYRYSQKVGVISQLISMFGNYRLATIPLAITLMLTGSYGVISAAENSLPGDKLYGVKLAAEQAQLKLTFDEEKQVQLHLQLSKKRLEEARQVIALQNPEREALALTALTKQTELTFHITSGLAANKAVAQNDTSLLENLVAINKEKRSVMETAVKSKDSDAARATALNTKGNDINLARLIAAVNEQSLLDLPNKISVTGVIANQTTNNITVENNIFTINPATIMLSQEGDIIGKDNLKGQIAIIGTRDNNNLIAKKIVVIDPDAKLPAEPAVTTTPMVRGTITTSPSQTQSTAPANTTPETTTEPAEQNSVQKPSEATAGFIVEPSANQYPQ